MSTDIVLMRVIGTHLPSTGVSGNDWRITCMQNLYADRWDLACWARAASWSWIQQIIRTAIEESMPYPLIWCFDDWWWLSVLCCSMLQNLPYCTYICSFEFRPADSPETMIHNIPTDVKQSLTLYACMEASAFLKSHHTFIQVFRWTRHPILFSNAFLSSHQHWFPSAFSLKTTRDWLIFMLQTSVAILWQRSEKCLDYK